LENCGEALRRYGLAASGEAGAEELRAAVSALGRITGRVDVEDVLGAIFQEFCIGK
jgi:tRNA modification GTPase